MGRPYGLLSVAALGAFALAPLSSSAIRRLADGKDVVWCDIGDRFLNADGTMKKDLMPDCLHPNAEGHRLWAEAVQPILREACGRDNVDQETSR